MEMFWKASATAVMGVILWIAVEKHEKDLSVLLTLAVCGAVAAVAAGYLREVLQFVRELEKSGGLEGEMLTLLLKAVGISLTAEITGLVCADAGNSAMASAARFLGTAAILYVSIPFAQTLMQLIREILGVL